MCGRETKISHFYYCRNLLVCFASSWLWMQVVLCVYVWIYSMMVCSLVWVVWEGCFGGVLQTCEFEGLCVDWLVWELRCEIPMCFTLFKIKYCKVSSFAFLGGFGCANCIFSSFDFKINIICCRMWLFSLVFELKLTSMIKRGNCEKIWKN